MAFPIYAILGFLALVFLLYHLFSSKTRRNKNSKVQDVPEIPGALPIIGHLHLLGNNKSVVRWLGKMADKHGPSLMLRFGMRHLLVVSSPELVKECFTTNDMNFASRPKADATKYMGYDYAIFPLASYGPYWREIRKIAVLELLSNQRLDLLKNIRATEIHVFIQNIYLTWESNNKLPIEFKERFGDLTFNMMTMLVVGKRYFGRIGISGEGDASRLRRALHDWADLTGALVLSDLIPFLRGLDFQGMRKAMKRTAKEIDYFMQMWLDEHRQGRRSGENNEKVFMEILISIIKDAHVEGYGPDSIIKATCLAAVIGGTDTAFITLGWALSLLLNHRHVLKRAQEELDRVIGKDRNVEESDLPKLAYMQAIVKEVLRMYPPAPLSMPHENTEDCYVGGYRVPAGTILWVNLWKLHRDPRVWSDPEEFRPERFLTQHTDVDVRGQNFEYIPFGSGRRGCPGISLALHVLNMTLARLIHGFDLTTPFDAPVDMTETKGVIMPRANPLEVIVTPRLPSRLYV